MISAKSGACRSRHGSPGRSGFALSTSGPGDGSGSFRPLFPRSNGGGQTTTRTRTPGSNSDNVTEHEKMVVWIILLCIFYTPGRTLQDPSQGLPGLFFGEVLLGSLPRCEPGRWYISRHRISSARAILSCGWS